ncbi:hypothetical protein A6A06_06830 [Streptomyces sp. CB02923]|uniref:hypothetical protein n=1 Tax=Streptomyces sp. CB02923 TaxID=1718985 RepID=UPI00093EFE8D|nr:hypothetical protein [Streptomyces sp. CB02923]OKI04503.1 hypothetical protein A6A06_06830 [Streptomyces sp. CB02923]
MRSPGFTLCAALAVTVLSPVPALASADRAPGAAAGTVAVTPSAPAPGTDTALQVTGCAGRDGRATSDAFVDAVPLARVAAGLVGDARVRSSADPGTYTVSVHCDGEDARAAGTFEVVPAPAGAGGDADAGTAADAGARDEGPAGGADGSLASASLSAPAPGTAGPASSPSALVRAGGGWTAAQPHRAVAARTADVRPEAVRPAAVRPEAVRMAAARKAASREGDGVYAVGLVLAGGAALALTGQVLRMRRRRKRSGDGDAG